MPGPRILLAGLLLCGIAAPVGAGADNNGLFTRKPRVDQPRVRFLAELLRTETDEKKRKAAVTELAEADPRAHPEVMTTLITALKKDAATVRAAAADVIGRFKTVFPLAGAALEHAAESDTDPAVREAAKQALWEYHLNGYRSAKGADAFLGQTAEPPLAGPGSPRLPPVPSATPLLPVPPPDVMLPTPPALPEIASLPRPPIEPLPGPRVRPISWQSGPRNMLSPVAARPTRTDEPPVAKQPEKWTPPSATAAEPPFPLRRPETTTFGTPPAILYKLPPIVPPPGPIPGTATSPEPTAEPPLRKPAAR